MRGVCPDYEKKKTIELYRFYDITNQPLPMVCAS